MPDSRPLSAAMRVLAHCLRACLRTLALRQAHGHAMLQRFPAKPEG